MVKVKDVTDMKVLVRAANSTACTLVELAQEFHHKAYLEGVTASRSMHQLHQWAFSWAMMGGQCESDSRKVADLCVAMAPVLDTLYPQAEEPEDYCPACGFCEDSGRPGDDLVLV